MNFANASKLDRKSGVRWRERGAPVLLLSRPAVTQTPQGRLKLGCQRSQGVLNRGSASGGDVAAA